MNICFSILGRNHTFVKYIRNFLLGAEISRNISIDTLKQRDLSDKRSKIDNVPLQNQEYSSKTILMPEESQDSDLSSLKIALNKLGITDLMSQAIYFRDIREAVHYI